MGQGRSGAVGEGCVCVFLSVGGGWKTQRVLAPRINYNILSTFSIDPNHDKQGWLVSVRMLLPKAQATCTNRNRSAQPGFLNSSVSRRAAVQPSWIQRFWAEEIMHPTKFWGNMSLAWSVSFFALGILFVRKAGFLLSPTF